MTRAEYMTKHSEECMAQGNGFNSHRKFYGQFATLTIPFLLRMEHKIKVSKDPYFNDIPLSYWENLPCPQNIETYFCKIAQTKGMAPSDWICIYKEAARQLKEQTQ